MMPGPWPVSDPDGFAAAVARADAEDIGRCPGNVVARPGYGKRHRECALPMRAGACPPGTVWQCGCGRTWVSLPTVPGSPGFARWRREHWLGKLWRVRREWNP